MEQEQDLGLLEQAREELATFLAQAEETGQKLRAEVFAKMLRRVETRIALANGETATVMLDEDGEIATG
jgi:F0F1-type ATP synthase membrane subunit b/b'